MTNLYFQGNISIFGAGVTLHNYGCHGDHTTSNIISELIYMIRVSSMQVLEDFEGSRLDTLAHEALSDFIHSLIWKRIWGYFRQNMVYKPKWYKYLSFAVETVEVCPCYLMKHKYEENFCFSGIISDISEYISLTFTIDGHLFFHRNLMNPAGDSLGLLAVDP